MSLTAQTDHFSVHKLINRFDHQISFVNNGLFSHKLNQSQSKSLLVQINAAKKEANEQFLKNKGHALTRDQYNQLSNKGDRLDKAITDAMDVYQFSVSNH